MVFAWVYFRAPDLATANRIVLGMLGQFGAAIPEPILSRLGPLTALFEHLGIKAYLGGGANFAEMWLWVIIAGLLGFLAPNTQQIMARFEPALSEAGHQGFRLPRYLVWQPTRHWAFATGLLMGLGVLALSRPTEFLYFQF